MPLPLLAPRGQNALGRAAACAAVAALLAGACEERESRIERRHRVFGDVAALVNGPFAELQPLDETIAARGSGDVVLLDARWDACLKAAPVAARIAGLSFPPDEQGKALEATEALRRAAARFHDELQPCGGGHADPACIARCTRGWSSLARAAENLRLDADWVGVRVHPVGPPSDAKR